MKRNIQSEIQEIADRILLGKLPTHWIKRDQNDQNDLGIDFEIEITEKDRNNASSISTGFIFKIQNKGHQTVSKLANGNISQQLSIDNANYLFNEYSVPVLLTITDLETETIYWHSIQLDNSIKEKLLEAKKKRAKSIQIWINENNKLSTESIKIIQKYLSNCLIAINSKSILNNNKAIEPDLFESGVKQSLREQLFQFELNDILKESKDSRANTLKFIFEKSEDPNKKYIALNTIYYDAYNAEEHNVHIFKNHLREFRKLAKVMDNNAFVDYLGRVKFSDLQISLDKFNSRETYDLTKEEKEMQKKGIPFMPEIAQDILLVIRDIKHIHRGIKLFGLEKVFFHLSKYLNAITIELFPIIYFWRIGNVGDILVPFNKKIKEIFHPLWAMGVIFYKVLNKDIGISYLAEAVAIDFLMTQWTIELTNPQKIDHQKEFEENKKRCIKLISTISNNEEDQKEIENALWKRTSDTQIMLIEYSKKFIKRA